MYSEKEGLFTALRAQRWPERHDCALLTSKGHASGAAKDIIDFLAGTAEAITVFCIHDADTYGTMIYQALQEETRARPGRKIEIVNLGLDPEETLGMRLEVEQADNTKARKAVAKYVPARWAEWLQKHRVELNAMTTPQFIEWLDRKLAPYESRRFGKVVPPRTVIHGRLYRESRDAIRAAITERILREVDLDQLVEDAARSVGHDVDEAIEDILDGILEDFEADPTRHWSDTVKAQAKQIAAPFGESTTAA